jgi:hypothetical protein
MDWIWFGWHDQYDSYAYQTAEGMFLLPTGWEVA